MKASVSPVGMIFLACLLAAAGRLTGEDIVIQKDGQRREGQVVAVKSGVIRLKVGPAETGLPLTGVTSVVMAPPKEFSDALVLWNKGNAADALPILRALSEKFQALPTPWAERTAVLLIESLLSTGDTLAAEAAIADLKKFYPDAGMAAEVALARLAFEKKDLPTARQKLLPIVEVARKTERPKPGESAVFGAALFLMGRIQESSGSHAEALANYILAAHVFREDELVSSRAAARAAALEEKNVIVP